MTSLADIVVMPSPAAEARVRLVDAIPDEAEEVDLADQHEGWASAIDDALESVLEGRAA